MPSEDLTGESADQMSAFLALNDSDPEVRMQNVCVVKDLDVLGQIAQSDDDESIRLVAVRKVKDQKVLFEVARRDQDAAVRLEAVKRIKDQGLLEQLAIPPRADVCVAAMDKLIDEDRLVDIACDRDLGVGLDPALARKIRRGALDGIRDEERLVDLALDIGNGPRADSWLKQEAVERICRPSYLHRIIDESTDSDVLWTASQRQFSILKRINR